MITDFSLIFVWLALYTFWKKMISTIRRYVPFFSVQLSSIFRSINGNSRKKNDLWSGIFVGGLQYVVRLRGQNAATCQTYHSRAKTRTIPQTSRHVESKRSSELYTFILFYLFFPLFGCFLRIFSLMLFLVLELTYTRASVQFFAGVQKTIRCPSYRALQPGVICQIFSQYSF